jgi:hypothetical protein
MVNNSTNINKTNTTSHLNSLNINNYHDIWQWKSGGGVTPVNEQTNDHKPAHQVAGLHQSMNRQTITNLHIRWRNYTSQWTNKRSQTCTSGGGITSVNEQTNDHKPAHQVAGLHQSTNKQTITNLHIRWRDYTSQWTNKRSQTCPSGGGITPVNEQTNDHKPAQIHGHSNDHILSQKWMII